MEEKIKESPTFKLQALIVSWRTQFKENIGTVLKEIKNRTYIKLRVPKIGSESVLENFILEGANLDVLEQRGVLCIPYSFWNINVIRMFLKHGRDINSRDDQGNTALILAARYSLYSVMQFLLSNGADPNISNLMGETALFVLIKHALWVQETALPGEDDFSEKTKHVTVEMLINSGAAINAMDTKGLTLLHYKHVFTRFDEITRKFEDNGLYNIQSSKLAYERTPLIAAAVEGDRDFIEDLINCDKKNAVEINAEDMLGFRAIHYAAMKPDIDRYKYLWVRAGVDTNVLTISGRSVTELVCLYGNGESLDMKNEEPSQQIMVFEVSGAIAILDKRDYKCGIKLWKKALSLRDKHKLPKLELTQNQKSVYKITKEYETKKDLENLSKMDLISTALLTLEQSFPDEIGCWNLLFGISKVLYWQKKSGVRQISYPDVLKRVMEIFAYLCDKMKITEDYKGLLDPPNMDTVSKLVCFIYWFLDRFFGIHEPFIKKWATHIQFLAKLCGAYIKAWKKKVDNNVTPYFDILYRVCHVLALADKWVENVIDLKLMWAIVDEDPRDYNGNSIMHIACYGWECDLLKALLVRDSYIMSVKNMYGETPIQAVPTILIPECEPIGFDRLVQNGAHLDLANLHWPADSESQLITDKCQAFPYTSLQCLCARVLRKGEVVYKNRVPKHMVDFINSHYVPELPNEPLKWDFELSEGNTYYEPVSFSRQQVIEMSLSDSE